MCNRDCFNCPYEDCIEDSDRLTRAEYISACERDSECLLHSQYYNTRRKYEQTEKGRARQQRYERTDNGKARRKARQQKYEQTISAKERAKAYNSSEKGKERWRRYYQRKKLKLQGVI